MKYTNVLRKANGDAYTQSELAGAAWFFIDRATAGSYIGCIKDADIFVWTAEDGTFCTVTNTGAAYLTGTSQGDYHFRSIQDTTIITNKTVNTAMQPAGSFAAGSVATLKLNTLTADDEFTVTINNVDILSSNGNDPITSTSNTTYDDMLFHVLDNTGNTVPSEDNRDHHLIDAIVEYLRNDTNFSTGTWYVESYPNSIVIRHTDAVPAPGAENVVLDYSAPTGNPVAFEIDARGGVNNTALEVFEDDVTDVSKLPLESFGGHIVKILNSNNAEDDYYVKFVAYDSIINRGRGYWEETHAPDVSPGLDPNYMPHRLSNTG
jgi:hypothetical protein